MFPGNIFKVCSDCEAPDTQYNVSRVDGVGVGPRNGTSVQFNIRNIRVNESGVWNITMYLSTGGRLEMDSRLLLTTVTNRATVRLSGNSPVRQSVLTKIRYFTVLLLRRDVTDITDWV